MASNRTALPETCGKAAVLVDPDDPDAVATALHNAVDDVSLRRRLSEAGLRRSAELSWERAAQATGAVLATVTGR